MSPELGRTGIKGLGSIDFLLVLNKWGIEFTREGYQIEEHYSRFLPEAKYYSWVGNRTVVDWVLVDFQTNQSIKASCPYTLRLPGGG